MEGSGHRLDESVFIRLGDWSDHSISGNRMKFGLTVEDFDVKMRISDHNPLTKKMVCQIHILTGMHRNDSQSRHVVVVVPGASHTHPKIHSHGVLCQ